MRILYNSTNMHSTGFKYYAFHRTQLLMRKRRLVLVSYVHISPQHADHHRIQNLKIEPAHNKTYKMACAVSEDSDQPGNMPSLIRVIPVCMKKSLLGTHAIL